MGSHALGVLCICNELGEWRPLCSVGAEVSVGQGLGSAFVEWGGARVCMCVCVKIKKIFKLLISPVPRTTTEEMDFSGAARL